ncbi:hypothetical protein R80B4_00246 [Fibrobacteres bacterium R8-0-B4]
MIFDMGYENDICFLLILMLIYRDAKRRIFKNVPP